MNVQAALALFYVTADEVETVDTPDGPVGYARTGSLLAIAMPTDDSPAPERIASLLIHTHDSNDQASECLARMVRDLRDTVDAFNASERSATMAAMYSV